MNFWKIGVAFGVAVSCAAPAAEEFGPTTSAPAVELHYDVPDSAPVWFGGESKAENACAAEYCIYTDIAHSDGTFTYSVQAMFTEGTHGWEKSSRVVYPKAPVKWIKAYALYRNPFRPGGEVKFRNVFVERREPRGEPLAMRRMTGRPFADRDEWLVSSPTKNPRAANRFTYVPVTNDIARCGAVSPLAADEMRVWTADSMRRITPLTFPIGDERSSPASVSLQLAKGERESSQLLISTGARCKLPDAELELSPLVNAKGEQLKGAFEWRRIGCVARRPGYVPHPCGVDSCEKWIPEVLLPMGPMPVPKGGTQGAWITVFAARDAEAGVYSGAIAVKASGKTIATVPVTVEVWNFALPETFSFPAMFALMDGFISRHYPDDFTARHREAIDMMLDHRLDWTDISRTSPPDIEDVAYAKSRGQRHVNLLNLVPPPLKGQAWVCHAPKEAVFSESFFTYVTNTLTPCVAELRRRGLFDGCCIYGFDERSADYFEGIDRLWRRLKGVYPDLPLITSAYMFMERVKHPKTVSPLWTTTDWHTPMTTDYREDVSDELRSLGKKVWWYTSCYPFAPHCNFASFENPLVEGRLIPWLTHRFRADGFLYWNVNYWTDQPKIDERKTCFPEWNTWNSLRSPGDGILAYPGERGILPSIRLANIRDGSEDYDYLVMASAKDPAAVRDIEKSLIRTMTDFSRDPLALRAARARLAGIILRR